MLCSNSKTLKICLTESSRCFFFTRRTRVSYYMKLFEFIQDLEYSIIFFIKSLFRSEVLLIENHDNSVVEKLYSPYSVLNVNNYLY